MQAFSYHARPLVLNARLPVSAAPHFPSVDTRTIDGQAIAREFREGLMRRVGALAASGVRPGLAAVQVGNHPVSKI